jgi:hypothetical protein
MGSEDFYLPILWDMMNGKWHSENLFKGNARGSVNHRGALFALRYIGPGKREDIIDWFEDQARHGHMSLRANKNPQANEIGSTVYSWMHEFINACVWLTAKDRSDQEVLALATAWFDRHVTLNRLLETPSGDVVSPGTRSSHLDTVSRDECHKILTRGKVSKKFKSKWERWSNIRGNWNATLALRMREAGYVPEAAKDIKLANPMRIQKNKDGHIAWFPEIYCASAPLYAVRVSYPDNKIDYVTGEVSSNGGKCPDVEWIPTSDFVEIG